MFIILYTRDGQQEVTFEAHQKIAMYLSAKKKKIVFSQFIQVYL